MTLLNRSLGFFALALLLFACRKEKSAENGRLPGSDTAQWEFTQGSIMYEGDITSAAMQPVNGVNTLSLVGTETDNEQAAFVLQIFDNNIEPGDYHNPNIFFQYSLEGAVVYQNTPLQNHEFTVTINSVDEEMVSGTFFGTVQDAQGGEITITNGKFTASLSDVSNPPVDEKTGILTVWSKSLCQGGGNIEVFVGGLDGEITQAMPSEPACAATGALNFTLPVGYHTVAAYCGTDSIRYGVTIEEDACLTLEVDFASPPVSTEYLPLGEDNFWEYSDFFDPSFTHRVDVDGSESDLDGRTYVRLVSTLGDTSYYRKEGTGYYQYREMNFQGLVNDPPYLDVPVLFEDYLQNQSWETVPVEVRISGTRVFIKLTSHIRRRDYQDNINGTDYPDLIEVETELWFAPVIGGPYTSTGNYYRTVFAKGVGIVQYIDLERAVEWGITDYNVVP